MAFRLLGAIGFFCFRGPFMVRARRPVNPIFWKKLRWVHNMNVQTTGQAPHFDVNGAARAALASL